MKRLINCILITCAIFAVGSCNKEDLTGKKLRIICEEIRPYTYVENSQLKGISAEIVAGIMNLMKIDDPVVEVTADWDGAYQLLTGSDNVALFTTGLTAARKADLLWVGPLAMLNTGLTGLKSGGTRVANLNEAKSLPSVGVVTGYPTAAILETNNFSNIHYFNNLSDAINALYEGNVSALFDLTNSIRMITTDIGRDTAQLDEWFNYSTVQGYIAFSKGVSPKLVASWQDKLDQLKQDGTVQRIYDQYLPGVRAPGLISIFTEENPPQNYRSTGGSLTGSSVEMVELLMKLTGNEEDILLTNWTNAYDQILVAPNSMVFSTLKTPARDTLFHWVGPVCRKSYVFYVRTNGTVNFNTLEGAKAVGSIGVPEGWASQQELVNQGFTNIKTFSTTLSVFQKLMDGTIDAAVLNDISIQMLAGQAGYAAADVRSALLLSSNETYLAFSKDTKPEYVEQWQQAYSTIRSNGKFLQIWKKWYPAIDW